MRVLIFIFLVFNSSFLFAQKTTIQSNFLKVKDELQLKGQRVTDIVTDTSFVAASDVKVATQLAVKKYADGTIAGRPFLGIPTVGQTIKWDGSKWIPADDSGGGSSVVNTAASIAGNGSLGAPLSLAQQGAAIGQVLEWNGLMWVPQSPVQEVSGITTITQLSALTNAKSEQVAFVKDSLRGGTFALKSAAGNTVDNGIVFPSAISGKVWVRQYDGLRSALWYGIKKDGITDNTSLYATVLASLPASSTLYFPSGSYKGDIVLDGSVAIRGEGLATVLISTTTGNAITLTNHPNELGKLVISGFKLIGYNGIVFSTPIANKWHFRDIDIQVSNIGVKKEHGNIYNTYENLSIYGGQYGLWAVNSPIQVMHTGGDLWLKCRFVNSAKAGVYVNDQSFGSGSLVFQQCFFEGNFGFGVFVKQFGAGLVVSAPSLRFVDCWNEANFVSPSVVIDGVTYDSLNTVKISKAVAIFDGSPCALDARNYGFVTFLNLKTDGIENYIRTDSTSFVQYKNCGLSRTNEGNVLFDGLTAFETGNQNSAQIPSRKLKVNHPKTIKTIDFSNTSPIVPGTTISGGVLFDKCQRYTLTGGTSVINLIPIVSGKIGVWTMDIRNKSNATNFQLVSTLSLGTVALANDSLWHTYAGIQINPSTGNAGINLPAGSGTIDLSAFQYLEFTDMKEAIEFWNSEKYATGKPVEVSGGTGTQDYVIRFTSSNTIGNSQIRDNGTAVGIGMAPNNTFRLGLNGQLLQTATNPYFSVQNAGSNFFVSGSSANITGGGANDFDAFLYGNNTFNILTNSTKRVTLKGDGSIGFNTASPQSLSVQIQGLNSTSNPATSGVSQSGLITRFSTPATSAVLDLGNNGGSGSWLQSTDNSSLSATYPLLLNPNGGNIAIGRLSAASRLDVNGVITSTGVQNNGNEVVTGTSTISGVNTVNNSIVINGLSSGVNTTLRMKNNGTDLAAIGSESDIFGGSSSDFATFVFGANRYSIATAGTRRLNVLGNGKIGINTLSPIYDFEVNGQSAATRFITDQPGSHTYYESRRSGVVDFEISNVNGSYWHYNGTGYSFFIEKNTGFVGINTGGNASQMLDVNGNIKSSSWTSAGNRLLFASSTGVANESSLDPARILTSDSSALGDITGLFSNLQLAANVVTSNEIATSAVTNGKIADNAVGTTKIISGAVTGIKVAAAGANNGDFYAYGGAGVGWGPAVANGDITGPVSNLQLGASVVGTTELNASAVSTIKIADAAVTSAKIAPQGVVPTSLQNVSGTIAASVGANAWWSGTAWAFGQQNQESYTVVTGTGTVSASANRVHTVFNPGSTQATMTVNLHPGGSPAIGQIVSCTFVDAITSLTISSNGAAALLGMPTTATAGKNYTFKFLDTIGGNGTWVLMH